MEYTGWDNYCKRSIKLNWLQDVCGTYYADFIPYTTRFDLPEGGPYYSNEKCGQLDRGPYYRCECGFMGDICGHAHIPRGVRLQTNH